VTVRDPTATSPATKCRPRVVVVVVETFVIKLSTSASSAACIRAFLRTQPSVQIQSFRYSFEATA